MLIADPLNPGPAIEQANPSITLLFCLLGILVWRLGTAYALFFTLPRVSGRAAARRLGSTDRSRVPLRKLDERLASMETEIGETRREIRALERGETSTQFDERNHLESHSTTDGARAERKSDESTDDSSDRSASTSAAVPSPSSLPSDASRDDSSERDGCE